MLEFRPEILAETKGLSGLKRSLLPFAVVTIELIYGLMAFIAEVLAVFMYKSLMFPN